MQRRSLLAGVTALLAACAAVPEPQYGTDHPANARAAPAPQEPQSNTLSSYRSPAAEPSAPPDNAMDHSQMKHGGSKDTNPADSKEGNHDH